MPTGFAVFTCFCLHVKISFFFSPVSHRIQHRWRPVGSSAGVNIFSEFLLPWVILTCGRCPNWQSLLLASSSAHCCAYFASLADQVSGGIPNSVRQALCASNISRMLSDEMVCAPDGLQPRAMMKTKTMVTNLVGDNLMQVIFMSFLLVPKGTLLKQNLQYCHCITNYLAANASIIKMTLQKSLVLIINNQIWRLHLKSDLPDVIPWIRGVTFIQIDLTPIP